MFQFKSFKHWSVDMSLLIPSCWATLQDNSVQSDRIFAARCLNQLLKDGRDGEKMFMQCLLSYLWEPERNTLFIWKKQEATNSLCSSQWTFFEVKKRSLCLLFQTCSDTKIVRFIFKTLRSRLEEWLAAPSRYKNVKPLNRERLAPSQVKYAGNAGLCWQKRTKKHTCAAYGVARVTKYHLSLNVLFS